MLRFQAVSSIDSRSGLTRWCGHEGCCFGNCRQAQGYPEQQGWPCCIDGHFADPYEQNTQQSPGSGRNSSPQLLH
jgi:hypothetical protein